MFPYIIAGAIGFAVAKLFEEDDKPKYADGGQVEGEYSDLSQFLDYNPNYIPILSQKYNINENDWEDYVNGELGFDEEIIENILGDTYKVFYNQKNDVFEIKKKKVKLNYSIQLASENEFDLVEKVIEETGIYSTYKPRFSVKVNNDIVGGSTYFIDSDNLYNFDLAIIEDYQGYGISNKLIDEIIKDAINLKTDGIKVYVVNDALFNNLEKLGFETYISNEEKYAYKKFDDGGSVLLAPNGKPSNLTPEQYDLVRTPAFKKWFGDWENDTTNASKVVDENGEPKVMYHQTSEEIKDILYNEGIFKKGFELASRNDKETPYGFFFKGSKSDIGLKGKEQIPVFLNSKKPLIFMTRNGIKSFFSDTISGFFENNFEYETNDKKYNAQFDKEWEVAKEMDLKHDSDEGKVFYEEWDIRTKKILDEWKEKNNDISVAQKKLITDYFNNNEYDSMVIEYDEGSFGRQTDTTIVFEPNQIKLADGSNTTFDGNNPDIRYTGGGEARPFTDDGNKLVVFNEYRNYNPYKIAVDDVNNAKYITLWKTNKNTGVDKKVGTLSLKNITDDDFLSVSYISIDKGNKGLGLGLEMYKIALRYSSDKIKGIKSYLPLRDNKRQIPKIYKKLNSVTEYFTWDVIYKQNNPDIRYVNGGELQRKYQSLIEGYELALEIETEKEKINMYQNLIEGYKLALELEDEEIEESKQIKEVMNEEVIQDDFKPSYLMTLQEYQEEVTPLIQAYKKFLKKNKDYFIKPDYYSLAHYSLEEALEQIDDEDSAFARTTKYSTYKNKKEKEETIRENYGYKKGDKFNKKYTQAPTPPNLIAENKEYIEKLKKYFSIEDLNHSVEDDETKSNKRAVRRAIDNNTYKDLLTDKKVELSRLQQVAESVGIRLPKSIFDKSTQNQMKYEAELGKLLADIPILSFQKLQELIKQIEVDLIPLEELVYEQEYARYSKLIEDNIGTTKKVESFKVVLPMWSDVYVVKTEYKKENTTQRNWKGEFYTESVQYIEINSLKSNWQNNLSVWVKEYVDSLKNSIIIAIMRNFQSINMPIQYIQRLSIEVGKKGFEGSYKFVFENGSSFIMNFQGIGAGGYNIQSYHFRYLTNFSDVKLADGSKGGTNYYDITKNFSTKR
jgi:ribosomal protein S18 acetylase RimI-like enzyme